MTSPEPPRDRVIEIALAVLALAFITSLLFT